MNEADWAVVFLGGIGAATGVWAVFRSGKANDIAAKSLQESDYFSKLCQFDV